MVIYPFQGSVLLKGRSETRRKNLPFDKISLRDLFFAKFRGFSDDPKTSPRKNKLLRKIPSENLLYLFRLLNFNNNLL